MVAVLPGIIMCLVILLLLGQLVAAAQFGEVFRRAALNLVVDQSDPSAISISGGAYSIVNKFYLKVPH